MGPQNRLLVLTLIGALVLFEVTKGQGGRECYQEGTLNVVPVNYTSVGSLRIVEGIVEVCNSNLQYESVCDIGWDTQDARVACTYFLSLDRYVPEALSGLGFPRRQYSSRTYNCSTSDYSLRSCNYSSSIDPECHNGPHVAGFRCTEVCRDGEINIDELTSTFEGGLSTYRGRVEICVNRTFGSVCDIGWDSRDAQVLCNSYFGSNIVGEVHPGFPLPPRTRYIAQNVACNGTESSLTECNYSPPTDPECYVGNRSAAVVCREVCTEGNVQLDHTNFTIVNDLDSISGVVQVCVNQQYVYVCADNWDNREADVACRSYRGNYRSPYYENRATTSSVIPIDAPVYRYSMCNGTESHFRMCQLPRSDSGSTCPSIGTVNCTEVISQCYSEARFRLANSTTDFSADGSITIEGRIELCTNSSHRSLCDFFWDPVDAQVYCRYRLINIYGAPASGNITAQPITGSQYGYSRAAIAPYDVTCNGSERRLEDCGRSIAFSSFCDPTTNSAGVVCTYNASSSTLPPTTATPTPTVSTCTEFELRLGNPVHSSTFDFTTGTSHLSVSGNVEVCIGGLFYSICDEGWGQEEAQVACNALNYPSRDYQATPLSGLTAIGPIIAENVICFGNETSAVQCNFTAPPVSPRCSDSSNAAGVQCTQVRTSCDNEGEINLLNPQYEGYLNIFTGGQVNLTGRVGVCRNGFFDTVCDANWDAKDAAVFCRTLIPQTTAIPLYGLSTGRETVALENVTCTGNESNIANCSTSPIGQISNPVCREPNRTAGVLCSTTDDYCADTVVRLVGGPTFYEGRVEVCRNSRWLPVCDVGVNSSHAFTACERRFHFGDNGTAIYGSAYGQGTGPQLAFCSIDTGYSSYIDIVPIENCTSNPGLQGLCSRSRELGVRCEPGILQMSITATDEAPMIGSTSFALECFANELPWEARLDSEGWYKSGTLLPLTDSVSTEVLHNSYNPSAFNVTYIFRSRVTFDRPLTVDDEGEYSCNVSVLLTYPDQSTYLLTNSTTYTLRISANDSGGDLQTPRSFLPFGPDRGDLTVPSNDDGTTDEIILGTDVVIFGSSHNRLYVNTNGVLSFGRSYTSPLGSSFSSTSSPPIIAPFWDDVDITKGGTIYYRQDSNSTIIELVQKAIASEFPEAASFQPSLVFVATWDRVQQYGFDTGSLENTFQVVVASDGTWTFVRFSYGDIQWGGFHTVIGVSAGDGVNFVIHPASSDGQSALNTTATYRVDGSTSTMVPTTAPPTTPPPTECFIEGEILPYLNETSYRGLRSFQGTFEVCIGRLYGSVCDIGWNQSAAQTLCHNLYGSNYVAEPLNGLGYPRRRYVAQHFNCTTSATGLESCSYNSLVDAECFVGPHVAGVRCTETNDTQISQSFLPFGPDRGDLTVPSNDDGTTNEIILQTNVVIFGSSHNRLYVNTNGVLSFGSSYTSPASSRFNFTSSPPIIAPFWDDVDITKGGTIYYRQDSNSTITELVQRAIASEFPEATSFQPSLVFVATWDRVQQFGFGTGNLENTFQVVVASDGTWTFVRFSYGDIQWGGPGTVIGVSAGDRVNFVTHPASLSQAVRLLDNTTATYRVDASTTTMVPTTATPTTPPPTECLFEGEILPYLNETSYRGLRSFQGTFEVCVGRLYGSVCDIGWNQSAAQTVCRNLYGSIYVAEPLYGLGYPRRTYVAQHFNCSTSATGLDGCSYNSHVDVQCFFGPRVAGVRCIERPPPLLGVKGFCSVVVWYSPMVPCEDIRGYEVRLYNPRLPRLNITNRVGANRTFYIVDKGKLVSSDETYVQVRIVHRIGVGEWSEGTSLGCEKPVTPETPTTTESPPRVYFELNGKIYYNNSAVSVSEIGEGTSALYCKTDKEECCGTVPNRFGQFYYPNGVQVPIANRQQGFYRNRGDQVIRLNRREGVTLPTGTYRCEIPNADDETVKIYITLIE